MVLKPEGSDVSRLPVADKFLDEVKCQGTRLAACFRNDLPLAAVVLSPLVAAAVLCQSPACERHLPQCG